MALQAAGWIGFMLAHRLALRESPAWRLTPIGLAALGIIASALVGLRARGWTRALATASGLVGVAGVGVVARAVLAPVPVRLDGSVVSLACAAFAIAPVPFVWALSRPGRRVSVWMATAAAFANVCSTLAPMSRPGEELGGVSMPTLAFGTKIASVLPFIGWIWIAIALLLPRRDDMRAPPPENAMSRVTAAVMLAALPPCGLALFSAFVASVDRPMQRGCLVADSVRAHLFDFPEVMRWFEVACVVAAVCVVVASWRLAPRLAIVASVVTLAEVASLWWAPRAAAMAWGTFESGIVGLAIVLTHIARARTREVASTLEQADRVAAEARIRRVASPLVAASAPTIAALLVVTSVDSAKIPANGLLTGAGFLGFAALVLLASAARAYTKGATTFSELARLERDE